jgi:hypothetical protein
MKNTFPHEWHGCHYYGDEERSLSVQVCVFVLLVPTS